MVGYKKKNNAVSAGKWFSICLMIFSLSFLTCINYFIYPGDSGLLSVKVAGSDKGDTDSNFPPSGPTEEKSTNSPSGSLTEEMLHEAHPEFNFETDNYFFLHHFTEADNIEFFHPELVSPPPKFSA